MSLNEGMEFSSAPSDVKGAFLGVPDKMWLKPGTSLYKYSSYPLVGREGRVTPWWSFVERVSFPSGGRAEGLRSTSDAARRLGVSQRRFETVRAAVSEKFGNNMTDFLLIVLKEGAWGFAGIASGQQEFKDPELANVYLIGGKTQVWIPGLKESQIQNIPAIG